MRAKFLYPVVAAFAAFFIHSCSVNDPVDDLKASKSSNTEGLCNCQEVDLQKTVGGERTFGTLTVCHDAENLYVTFATVNPMIKTHVGVFEDEPSEINPSPKFLAYKDLLSPPKQTVSTTTIALGDLSGTIYIAALATVQGGDGEGGGQIWGVGTDPGIPIFGNPNSRYFAYELDPLCVTPPPPGDGCSFSQGYWFAKPNVVWPGCEEATDIEKCGSVTIGGITYTREEARAIFRSKNAKTGATTAKKAFLQASTIQLSMDSGKDITDGNILTALATINTYFECIGQKALPTTINSNNFNKASCGGVTKAQLAAAAATLDAYIQANHCDKMVVTL
jgi:hypothetical protein